MLQSGSFGGPGIITACAHDVSAPGHASPLQAASIGAAASHGSAGSVVAPEDSPPLESALDPSSPPDDEPPLDEGPGPALPGEPAVATSPVEVPAPSSELGGNAPSPHASEAASAHVVTPTRSIFRRQLAGLTPIRHGTAVNARAIRRAP
jgi:hypothetical protein